MFNLIAQTQASPGFDWERVLMGYGPLGVFCGVCLYFLVMYGKRVAEGHIELVGTLKENSTKTTINLDKLTETQVELVKQAKDFKCRHP